MQFYYMTHLPPLLPFSSSTIAQQWYHVEIILFENLTHITPESAPDKTIPDQTTQRTIFSPQEYAFGI